MIYGARSQIFPLVALLNVWWISAVIWYMIYLQSHDKQVWKISDVENGKEVNQGREVDGNDGKREIDYRAETMLQAKQAGEI